MHAGIHAMLAGMHLPCRNAHEQQKFRCDAVSGAVTAGTCASLRYVTRYGVTLRVTLTGDPELYV